MYMRLVHARFRPEHLPDLRELYQEKVIPALQNVNGCLYASLIQGVQNSNECVSLTLWKDKIVANEYERSGVFAGFMAQVSQYFAEASEWKVQLSKDLTLEFKPVPEEAVIKTYEVTEEKISPAVPQGTLPLMYVRLVSPRIREGKLEEFKNIYREEILPVLREVKGCRYAYLTESASEREQVISITLWDSKRDAESYEASGLFDRLRDKMKHTFSEVYQWKMLLERETGGQVVTSEEMTVESFTTVTGKSFI